MEDIRWAGGEAKTKQKINLEQQRRAWSAYRRRDFTPDVSHLIKITLHTQFWVDVALMGRPAFPQVPFFACLTLGLDHVSNKGQSSSDADFINKDFPV